MDKERIAAQRKAIYDLDRCLWRARAEAERDSNYHTQLGHAIGALESLKVTFNIPTPSPNTFGTRSWFTVDELNEWAEAKLKEKNSG